MSIETIREVICLYNGLVWDTTEAPAPQPVTADELLTICRLLEGGGLAREGIFTKIRILADYAERQRQQGKRTITLSAK